MKKLLSLLLTLVMLVSLAGCGLTREDAELIAEVAEAVLSEAEATPEATETPEEAKAVLEDLFGEALREEIEASEETREEIEASEETREEIETSEELLDVNGSYTTREDVALYIHTYGCLPDNFITKKEAKALGWPGGDLTPYAEGKCIGGDWFGNYEGLLPTADGREYHECDIDTLGAASRGYKRIIYSNDGLIYYTGDHYKSFTLLYGEE